MNVRIDIYSNFPIARMLIMKKNILAALIAGTFIVGCNSGSDKSSASIQGFDGPVQFADAVYDCGTESGSLGQTDYDGLVSSTSFAINVTPELCEITITGNANSIDTSNGKLMPDIEYVIPRGLLEAGAPITASPLTTLIAKQIEADSSAVPPVVRDIAAVTTDVVADLYGADFINNTGVTVLELARDMEGTIKKLKVSDPQNASLVTATNHVVNDVLVYAKGKTLNIKSVVATSKSLVNKVIANNSEYPSTATGTDTFVTVEADVVESVYAVTLASAKAAAAVVAAEKVEALAITDAAKATAAAAVAAAKLAAQAAIVEVTAKVEAAVIKIKDAVVVPKPATGGN